VRKPHSRDCGVLKRSNKSQKESLTALLEVKARKEIIERRKDNELLGKSEKGFTEGDQRRYHSC
jgi:NADH:ubiquinone oxidoreductase subunit F (NADH-binding)